MKLRNKLIPLATVFATSATLAPVVLTSCSGGMVDLTNGKYVPTVDRAKHTESGITTDAALSIYVAAVNNNPEILKQDLIWSACHYYKTWDDTAGYTTDSLKAGVNNVKVQYKTIKVNDADTKVPCVSYTMSLVHNYHFYYKDSTYGVGTKYVYYSLDTEFVDVPFAYTVAENPQYQPKTDWVFGPNTNYLQAFDDAKLDWSFKFNETREQKHVYQESGVEKTNPLYQNRNASFTDYATLCSTYYGYWSGIQAEYDTVLADQYFYSYYLSNIEKA